MQSFWGLCMASKTDTQLEKLTNAIEKLISREVAPILPVAPVAPVAPIAPLVVSNSGDHDLLTKLDTKVDQIQVDITALKQNNSYYVTQDMHQEVVKVQADHEARIRIVETAVVKLMQWGSIAVVLVGIAEFLLSKFLK